MNATRSLLLALPFAVAALILTTHAQTGVGGKKPTHHWFCKSGDQIFDDDWAESGKDATLSLKQDEKLCKRTNVEHRIVSESEWQSKYRLLKVVR